MCPEDGHSCDPAAEYKLVTFRTGTRADAGSEGPFSIQGYGTLPGSCYESARATCTVAVDAGSDTVRVDGESPDNWIFTVTDTQTGYPLVAWGDVVDNVAFHTWEWNYLSNGTPIGPLSYVELKERFGAGTVTVDTYVQSDTKMTDWTLIKEYPELVTALTQPIDTDYYTLTDGEGTFDFKRKVTFETTTLPSAASGGPFTLEGYGKLPDYCYNTKGATCTIEVADDTATKIRITADTANAWIFAVKNTHTGKYLGSPADFEPVIPFAASNFNARFTEEFGVQDSVQRRHGEVLLDTDAHLKWVEFWLDPCTSKDKCCVSGDSYTLGCTGR